MNNPKLAIIVVPAQPTPTPVPPVQPGCAVQQQVKDSDPAVFVCYTQAQWDAKLQADDAQTAVQEANQQRATDAFLHWSGWSICGILLLLLTVFVIGKRWRQTNG